MHKRRVAITGLGVLSPNGIGARAYWDALWAGRSGVRELSLLQPEDHKHRFGGEVADFQPEEVVSRKDAQRLGRPTIMGLAAASEAWANSGLSAELVNQERLGIVSGASGPSMDVVEAELAKVISGPGYTKMSPFALTRIFTHEQAMRTITTLEDCQPGYIMTMSIACCSGSSALAHAAERIRDGALDAVLCGAADGTFTRGAFNAFEATRMMYREERSPEAIMRPWNVDRDGGVLSEGAAYLVLEEFDHAQARGAKIYGEWLGHSVTSPEKDGPDAQPIRTGLGRVMQQALRDAQVRPSEVDYVSAHAASSIESDREEAHALWDVFGDDVLRIPVSSIKSMIGNPIGAIGPMQVVALCGSFAEAVVPPTINSTELDPAVQLDVVPNEARRNGVELGIVNTHGIDGSNACLVIGAPNRGARVPC